MGCLWAMRSHPNSPADLVKRGDMGADDGPFAVPGALRKPRELDWSAATDRAQGDARQTRVIAAPKFSLFAVFLGLRTLAHYSVLLYSYNLFRLSIRYK